MCGTLPVTNLLDADPGVQHLIFPEDDFIRKLRLEVPGDELWEKISEPLWRIRSSFNDAVNSMNELRHVKTIQTEMYNMLDDFPISDNIVKPLAFITHPIFQSFLTETTIAAKEYLDFTVKVTQIFHTIRIIQWSMNDHCLGVLKTIIPASDAPQVYLQLAYVAKLKHVIDLADVIFKALHSLLITAERTKQCFSKLLKAISNYFYTQKLPLPLDPISRNFLMFYWHEFDETSIAENTTFLASSVDK